MATPEFYFQVLGANSALPTKNRFPSSFILAHHQSLMLIDCGEGAQIKMTEYGVKRSKIDHIFISHMHGDHVFGLPGFLNSLALSGRVKPMHLYGPSALKTYIEAVIAATGGRLGFELVYQLLEGDNAIDLGVIGRLKVQTIPLQHRIPTYGYLFTEVIKGYNINPQAISRYELSRAEIVAAKSGEHIKRGDQIIENKELTFPQQAPRSFAYCSDTVYDPSIVPAITMASMLYHEATYLDSLADKAQERMHSTAKEAGMIASAANVGQLVIGHYSSRYDEITPLLTEAQEVHPQTQLAIGGKRYNIT